MTTTAEEQLALELINRARNDPAGEYVQLIQNGSGVTSEIENALSFFNVDLSLLQTQLNGYQAVAPLAYNMALDQSAQTHTDLMNFYDQQSHNLPGEPSVGQRMVDAGYTGASTLSESIYAYTTDVLQAHAAFYIDWGYGPGGIQDPAGHRDATLNGNFTEVGISWDAWDGTLHPGASGMNPGPFLTTQHYGNRFSYEAQLLGVVINDADNDDFYDIGEGMGGVSITATGSAGTFVTTSWESGGYQMVVPDGIYTVTFSGGGLIGTVETTVTMAGDNVKVDAEAADAVTIENVVFSGTSAAETEEGSAGNDELRGGAGGDHLTGLDGNDSIWGDEDNDTIFGGNGDDDIRGGAGDDAMYGGADNDFLRGGNGTDAMFGGDGRDILSGQRFADTITSGAGDDRVFGGGGNDTLYGNDGDDFLRGGSRRDEIFGGDGNDFLAGNSFDDILYGGAGNDRLFSGGQNDTLNGGTGNDYLKGGTGADTFIFNQGDETDTIADFQIAEDTLILQASLLDGATDLTQILQTYGTVTSDGVLLNFGNGDVLLLDGLDSLDGLNNALDIA